MRAGTLRHRVTIQDKSVAQNSYGEEIITWTDVVTLWASVMPARGREYLQAGQEQATVPTIVRTRYKGSLAPSMRLVHDSRNYEILAINNVAERDISLEIICREEVNT